ncbi:MAG: ATP-binding protein [Acidobacteriota bacterium]
MQILSRLTDLEFFDREDDIAQLIALATFGYLKPRQLTLFKNAAAQKAFPYQAKETGAIALLLGAPRIGKTETLRKTFDRLFLASGQVLPVYFAFRPYHLEPEQFAKEYLSRVLAQFLAFRHQDAKFLALATATFTDIIDKASLDDRPWVTNLLDHFLQAKKAGDLLGAVRCALAAPMVIAAHTQLSPFVMLDNFHWLAKATEDNRDGINLRVEMFRAINQDDLSYKLSSVDKKTTVNYLMCGLQRMITEIIPADEAFFERLHLLRLEPLAEEPAERMIGAHAEQLGIEISESTVELMLQQLGSDLFYLRALLDAAAAQSSRLKSFMEFERIYTEEILQGRISYYFDAVLRDIAGDSLARRACIEGLTVAIEAGETIPITSVIERLRKFTDEPEVLLARMHQRELLHISYGFVAASDDATLADYVRAKYRFEVEGARRPIAGEALLGEKLKDSYRLMMSRYHRSIESQLVDTLSHFDFQAIPMSLFDENLFENLYRGLSRAQARQAIEAEKERLRLPQIVLVNDVKESEGESLSLRLFTASGFEGGIYSETNEALWLIGLFNSKEPLDVKTIEQTELKFEVASRNVLFGNFANATRWYISKEGFTKEAIELLKSLQAYHSNYNQLDALHEFLQKSEAQPTERRAANEVELIIPFDDEAELIAARTVEQIARSAEFDKESINQIKTALIEACINAAEHSNSPDRKIYLRFILEEDRLMISVANKGKSFGGILETSGMVSDATVGTRGRGLKIIRALMDEVKFERADDGTNLIMAKLLNRPQSG